MATFTEGKFLNSRGQNLYYRQWPAYGGPPKGSLVFHHGYGSHSGAYDPEFKRIAEAGISVFLYDAHSFGRSEPKEPKLRSLVQNFNHLADDIYTFREEVVDKALSSSPVPVFIAGLSMGGMTAILAAIREQSKWQGLICISPAVDCPRNFQLRIMEAIQGIVLRIAPGARLIPNPQIPDVTLNEEERKKLATDEFFDPGKVRVRMGNSFLQAWSHISKHEHELTLPILVHYSSIDKVVYPPATERFVKNVASKDVTVKPFDKFAHDIYLDSSKDESCSLLIEWMLAHLPGGGAIPTGVQPASDAAKL